MPDFQQVLNSEQTARLMEDSKKLEQIRNAPETQRLFQLLGQSAGDLEQAAGRAAQGDTGQLISAIQQLMKNPEGQRLIEKMKQSLQ